MSGEPVPRPRKSRRFTAPPQQVSDSALVGVFELPHGAGRPGTPAAAGAAAAKDAAKDAAGTSGEPGRTPGAAPAPPPAGRTAPPAPKADPVLDQQASDDDPRRWGDAQDDLGDWLKSQRPPHWE